MKEIGKYNPCYNQDIPRAAEAPSPALGTSGKLLEDIPFLMHNFYMHYYRASYMGVVILLCPFTSLRVFAFKDDSRVPSFEIPRCYCFCSQQS